MTDKDTKIKNLEIDNQAFRDRIAELEAKVKELTEGDELQKNIKSLIKLLQKKVKKK